jgi:hypothetical protein
MTTNTGLIVPIDVAAYCVGVIDANGQTGNFAGATTSYENQLNSSNQGTVQAYLGINVTRDPAVQPPSWPLEAGVHLHWAVPDSLAHANNTAGNLDFPALPNRWLVTRIVISGEQATGKSWIVESDTLSDKPTGHPNPPSLPVQEADSSRGFRYVGVWQVCDGSWKEPQPPAGQSFKDLFGSQIHVAASGDIAFAAFYPNARNVFGLYDDLQDVTDTPADLMYVVTGWFSDSTNDPLSEGLTAAQLQSQLGWTFDDGAGASPTYSLYSGSVQGVSWNPATTYITDSTTPVHIQVAVGNTPAEALAAYFRGSDFPTSPLFEQLFTLFETGLLSNLTKPQPGQLAEMGETLHERRFSTSSSGHIYTVVHKPPSEDEKGLDAQDISPTLPLPLADALNLLNR